MSQQQTSSSCKRLMKIAHSLCQSSQVRVRNVHFFNLVKPGSSQKISQAWRTTFSYMHCTFALLLYVRKLCTYQKDNIMGKNCYVICFSVVFRTKWNTYFSFQKCTKEEIQYGPYNDADTLSRYSDTKDDKTCFIFCDPPLGSHWTLKMISKTSLNLKQLLKSRRMVYLYIYD